ncbi:MAG TPA: tetratricopeptide repeat protein [Nitrospirae bacterium]|nr:TPR repeat-containing protein YrrB [bacterium BMS3Bbin08]HDH49880.1 tetratricopeptide repeat protein [Nitrospirota bacterium]HDK16665.1 tetratricopeptide repeat protein [Nitrospirota bacterium]
MKTIDLRRPFLHILLIIFLSLVAYSNTFHSPFQFDDMPGIVDNPIIKDLQLFVKPSKAEVFDEYLEYNTFKSRYVSYLTFALNYKAGGLNVVGYHIVNLIIHISAALVIYFLIMLTFRTPYLRGSPIRAYNVHIAFFTAVIFACHPIQTQAVTYIWQRSASLAALLYILSLASYIKWRLSSDRTSSKGFFFYLVCIISAILAMKTKEIAFMLPLTIALYEFLFFEGSLRRRTLWLIPIILCIFIIPLTLISIDKPVGELIGDMSKNIRGNSELSRSLYLITSFRVIITYIRLIFFPVGQNLDYDYPVYQSFFDTEVLLSFVFLVSLPGLSVYLYYRYRDTVKHIRLILFGVFWFFINLLLESSVIPLNNVIFEHRLYLPSIGVFLVITVLLFMAVEKLKKRNFQIEKAVVTGLIIITFVLTGAAYARNGVWKDEKTLWENVVKNSPDKPRGHINLGNVFLSQGKSDKAMEQYLIALKLDPESSEACYNLGNVFIAQGKFDKATEQYLMTIKLDPHNYSAHYNLGNTYQSQGLTDKAIEQYQTAIRLKPDHQGAYNNLGIAYQSQGLTDKAIEQYRTAIRLNPGFSGAYYNLGTAYQTKGLISKAREHYEMAAKLLKDRK